MSQPRGILSASLPRLGKTFRFAWRDSVAVVLTSTVIGAVMILPPQIFGPLSECSRGLLVTNVLPGAEVFLLMSRNGATDRAGHTTFKTTSGIATLDSGWDFLAGDLVSAYQSADDEDSYPYPD